DQRHRSDPSGGARHDRRHGRALFRLHRPAGLGVEGGLWPAAETGDDPGLRRRLRPAGHRLRLRGLPDPAVQARQTQRRRRFFGCPLMPRARGQIDEQKSQAILQAAASLFVEKGAKASMSEIARRAGVSKQTLYNRFATKTEIGRALAAQRSDAVTAPLTSGAEPEAVLAAIAETLISKICTGGKGASLRGVALVSPEAPELARAIYDAGPGESVRRIAAWLKVQDEARRLSVPDPLAAAEMFTGMALGHGHLRSVLGLPHPEIADLPARARDVARRFVRAFAPE